MIETAAEKSLAMPFFFFKREVGSGHVPLITVSAKSYSSARTAHCKKTVCAIVMGGNAFADDDDKFGNDVVMEDAILFLTKEAESPGWLTEFDDTDFATRFAKTGRIPLDVIAVRPEHNLAEAATASNVSSRCLAI